jgi:hypothetical protein
VRTRLEDDYAMLVPDRVDAIFLDGAVRERTARRLVEYVDRDRPSVVVVDNVEERYVAESIDSTPMPGYGRHDFLALQPSRDGGEEPHGTAVWLRSG